MTEEIAIHPVDIHIGQQLRKIRRDRGLSQSQVGAALDISFQQIQKYENGRNRVSGSAMWMLSRALDVPVSYFYEGLG